MLAMRRGPAVALLLAAQLAYADEVPKVPATPDVPVASDAPATSDVPATPATPVPLEPPQTLTPLLPATPQLHSREDHRLAAGLTLAGAYTLFGGWMYLAWYRQHKPLSQFKWGGDDEKCSSTFSRCGLIGWAGDTTYAGGADKFGHAWSTMSLARGGAELLYQWGGFGRTTSMLVSTGLAELLFIGVEVRDGFFFEFSFSDLGGDTVGALAALALMQWPRLDEMLDFRVQYSPSDIYLRKLSGSSPCATGGCSRWNIAEDYSGETYLLAFHLSSIHALRDMEYGAFSRFVDVTLGFDTRNYKPPPDAASMAIPRQEMFIGVALNAQGALDWLLDDHRTARKVTHGIFEVFQLPLTSLPVLEHTHSPTAPVMGGGA
jgi:hypothetical protein